MTNSPPCWQDKDVAGTVSVGKEFIVWIQNNKRKTHTM
ncbi:hypothetical protein H175_328p079 (plasmid) [Bacillus thuringiensis serovar thuringiensis str. IS5056]|nr:hypothetical protein H175_328p079 [Bacillus thuringiensis serovar thuringiensis str. IS5056]